MGTLTKTPDWVDVNLYPFSSHFLPLSDGKLHYLDEGKGDAILFVHGTPTWSFLYRNYIRELSKTHRCIALDHLGFGLSDKPGQFSGTPQKHAENLAALVDHLKLDKFTLVVHDFGGPIGLSYAISNPEKVSRIVLFNTWLWETKSNPGSQKIDKVLNSALGKFLYLNLNFSPKFLLKKGFFDRKKLNKAMHQHYKKPFPNKNSRYGLLNIGKSLVGSSDWYEQQWQKVNRISGKPFLVLWGDKDSFITKDHLEKWRQVLTDAQIHRFEAGHFVQEEKFEESLEKVDRVFKFKMRQVSLT